MIVNLVKYLNYYRKIHVWINVWTDFINLKDNIYVFNAHSNVNNVKSQNQIAQIAIISHILNIYKYLKINS